jgi:hypothetical protein
VHQDNALANFATRIRKRSNAKIACDTTSRKLAEICGNLLAAIDALTPGARDRVGCVIRNQFGEAQACTVEMKE